MKQWAVLATWIVLFMMMTSPMNALELEDLISRYTSETNGEGYLQPLADAFGGDTSVVILDLGNAGITTLRQQIEAILTDDLSASIFQVDFDGNSVPPSQRIVADITLIIKGTSEVEQCLNSFMSSGESCGE